MATPLPVDVQTKIASSGTRPSAQDTTSQPVSHLLTRPCPFLHIAAETFVDAYYTALQAARHTITSYYVAPETLPDGKTVPTIVWNGNTYDTGKAFEEAFADQMPGYTYFEVQSLDAQVLNPRPPAWATKDSGAAPGEDRDGDLVVGDGAAPQGRRQGGGGRRGQVQKEEELVGSLVLMVSGYVRLHEKKEGPQRGFSETFVLVPNKDWSRKDGGKRWVVQSQNFRYVV